MAFNTNKLENFLSKHITSFVSWDILVFFAHNTGVYDTAEGIARRLGRKTDEVKNELDRLVKTSFLNTRQTEEGIVYSLVNSSENEMLLEQFLAKMENRIFRLNLLSRLLKKRTEQGQTLLSL